jgi:hypothetical protein
VTTSPSRRRGRRKKEESSVGWESAQPTKNISLFRAESSKSSHKESSRNIECSDPGDACQTCTSRSLYSSSCKLFYTLPAANLHFEVNQRLINGLPRLFGNIETLMCASFHFGARYIAVDPVHVAHSPSIHGPAHKERITIHGKMWRVRQQAVGASVVAPCSHRFQCLQRLARLREPDFVHVLAAF